ncbi:hypothetical protein HZC07_01700 [Candidatus Micrarchaeota archaeon]|nr:hypothetical protein [Candidatus Micrarchaeota archaeon]
MPVRSEQLQLRENKGRRGDIDQIPIGLRIVATNRVLVEACIGEIATKELVPYLERLEFRRLNPQMFTTAPKKPAIEITPGVTGLFATVNELHRREDRILVIPPIDPEAISRAMQGYGHSTDMITDPPAADFARTGTRFKYLSFQRSNKAGAIELEGFDEDLPNLEPQKRVQESDLQDIGYWVSSRDKLSVLEAEVSERILIEEATLTGRLSAQRKIGNEMKGNARVWDVLCSSVMAAAAGAVRMIESIETSMQLGIGMVLGFGLGVYLIKKVGDRRQNQELEAKVTAKKREIRDLREQLADIEGNLRVVEQELESVRIRIWDAATLSTS